MLLSTIHLQALFAITLSVNVQGIPPALRVLHHSSAASFLNAVSNVIIGENEAIVIDSGFTKSAALDMIAFIKKNTNLPVTKIFATHEHPDHYFGATEFLKVYPNALLLASPRVVNTMKQHVHEKVNKWTSVYGPDEIPRSPRVAGPYRQTEITLKGNENEPIELLQPLQGDVEDVTVYWIPSQKILLAGDLVYSSKEHVWLAEAMGAKNRENWIRSLKYLLSLQPLQVIGGHIPGTEEPKVSDIDASIEYIEYFNRNVYGKNYSAKEIFDKMKSRFPDRVGLANLNYTATTYGRKE
ncbi:hypothetical protein K7432_008548 [Basidiobolus ranarum]|uniref:Metallo-beta-lactamase domain-containing protein n=1 Tax=Basidiobolus ranarum TaxID=34480 RepID=A0ABR2VYE4_9FUNG